MMPMPPTSRLTAATAPSSVVRTSVVPDSVSASCWVSKMLKLSSSPSASLRRSRSSWRQAGLQRASLSLPSCIDTSSVLTLRLPVTRRCSVCSGITHDVVLVVAHAALALGGQHADHLAGELLDAQLLAQAGLPTVPPKSSRRTVSPMTQTAAPARCSSSAKRRPAGELPVAGVEAGVGAAGDAGGPVAAVGHHGDAGAALRAPPRRRRRSALAMASASASLNGGAPPPPPPPAPGAGPGAPSAGWCPGWRSGPARPAWRRCPA